MKDFAVEEVCQMFGGFDFSGGGEDFTDGQSTKVWGNFQKYALNAIKI